MILKVNVAGNEAISMEPIDLVAEGVWERRDLQRWILSNPSVLGEDLLVLDEEFDQFQGSADRLDILCLDTEGAPVVVELKRDRHAGHADLQALRYAAKIKGLGLQAAAKIYRVAKARAGDDVTEDEATSGILRFLDREGDADAELLADPRIILASSGFSKDISTTVLYLRDKGVDITCIELRAYRTDEEHLVLVPDRLIPLPEVDEYLAKLEVREARQEKVRRKRRGEAFTYSVVEGLINDGQQLYLKHNLPSWVTFDADDDRFVAAVVARGSKRPNLRWSHDGQEYSASNLARSIFQQIRTDGGNTGGTNGANHWGTEDQSIVELARAHEEANDDE